MHWHAGRSLSEMAGSLDVDRKTLRKYIAPAVAAGIAPGGPRSEAGEEWAGLVPAAGRYAAAAGDLAGDREAPRVHHRPAEGRGADVDHLAAAAR